MLKLKSASSLYSLVKFPLDLFLLLSVVQYLVMFCFSSPLTQENFFFSCLCLVFRRLRKSTFPYDVIFVPSFVCAFSPLDTSLLCSCI